MGSCEALSSSDVYFPKIGINEGTYNMLLDRRKQYSKEIFIFLRALKLRTFIDRLSLHLALNSAQLLFTRPQFGG